VPAYWSGRLLIRKRWPDQFEELAPALRRRLGDAAVAIDHIGSTSVPGLAAKDIIDIQVTVSSGSPHRHPSCRPPRPRRRLAQSALRPAVPRLPADPPRSAAAYGQLKRALAERHGNDLAAYTELKDSACDLIVAAAQDWTTADNPSRQAADR
jgi:GrpB-like predicted nucleotidyltransferase (UPF0157 family)